MGSTNTLPQRKTVTSLNNANGGDINTEFTQNGGCIQWSLRALRFPSSSIRLQQVLYILPIFILPQIFRIIATTKIPAEKKKLRPHYPSVFPTHLDSMCGWSVCGQIKVLIPHFALLNDPSHCFTTNSFATTALHGGKGFEEEAERECSLHIICTAWRECYFSWPTVRS